MSDPGVEYDKLFDHDYDGIREYDNPMPKWWVYMFVLCTIFAFPYVLHYHYGHGTTVLGALEAEQAAYAEKLMTTYGDLQPDEPTLLQFMDDELAMVGMSSLFKGKCASCHLADGSGSVGPNLTDDHYLNVKQVTDIADIVSNGLVTKGMPAWKDKLTETQVVLLSSYVAQMRRQPIPGKPAQGETIPPWPPTPPREETPAPAE